MKYILLSALVLASFGLPASAAIISIDAPVVANGSFDVTVMATDLWGGGRDISTDGILSAGFDVSIDNPLLLAFDGATPGPLFDPTTPPIIGIDVFFAADGFEISDPVTEPLILAILHFTRTGVGSVNITLSSDTSDTDLMFFEGLQYFNEPYEVPIDGTVNIGEAPEPGTLVIAALGLALLGIGRKALAARP